MRIQTFLKLTATHLLAPWSIKIIDVFNEDKLYAFDLLLYLLRYFISVLQLSAKPNPCVTDNICGLMKTRDDWRKKAKKTNDPLSWTAFR